MRTKKHFGQHFLTQPAIIQKIIRELSPHLNNTQDSQDILVEIGPGKGAITLPLLEKNYALTAIDIDPDVIEFLTPYLSRYPKFKLIHQDALTVDLEAIALTLPNQKFKLIGNLPYNISTPLLFHFLKYPTYIQEMVLMVQKEVADRICSEAGNKIYGRLSVMVQAACKVEKCFTVPPGAFTPPPKVQSAVIKLIPYNALTCPSPYGEVNFAALSKLCLALFTQRRKTLKNLIKPYFNQTEEVDAFFTKHPEFSATQRPETLSVQSFIALSRLLV
jgi:16S rRNA (adenine1518-N6/adenine1519-N6)-dimethyltransferase